MKYLFFGGKAIGNYVLDGLIKNNEYPEGIVVYRDIIDNQLIRNAKSLGTRILQIDHFNQKQQDIIEFVKELNIDTFICVSFPFIISRELLDLVKYPINIHTGAIPKYRGYHPISAALLCDEPFQATTVHFMEEEVDAGRIILQDYVKVENEDDIVKIRQKLIELSLRLILIVIKQVKGNALYSRSQVGDIIWAPRRKPEDSKIDFSRGSRYLHNFIRALTDPYPNAFGYRNEDIVHIKRSIVCNSPGIVLAQVGHRKYIVSSGDGVVFIETDIDLKINDKLE